MQTRVFNMVVGGKSVGVWGRVSWVSRRLWIGCESNLSTRNLIMRGTQTRLDDLQTVLVGETGFKYTFWVL